MNNFKEYVENKFSKKFEENELHIMPPDNYINRRYYISFKIEDNQFFIWEPDWLSKESSGCWSPVNSIQEIDDYILNFKKVRSNIVKFLQKFVWFSC